MNIRDKIIKNDNEIKKIREQIKKLNDKIYKLQAERRKIFGFS